MKTMGEGAGGEGNVFLFVPARNLRQRHSKPPYGLDDTWAGAILARGRLNTNQKWKS